ncbi:MAG TPA: gluconate 2-dehydrogenase subunit 3 family protein [Acidimicrobiia bacterium]|nr:gluconate 2-dehydrogenase subunit 3 family protein [Acidimicrobiia bacterium]
MTRQRRSGPTPGGEVRFPGFDVIDQAPKWDPVTTGVVLSRLTLPPPLRFFTPAEEAAARPLLDRLLAQDDEPRVPVFELIDARLAEGEIDGWRYDNMPEDGQAWKQSLAHLDTDAKGYGAGRFADLGAGEQAAVLEAVRTAEHWHGLPAGRLWELWMRYACAAFYSHPWAWNEIGFPGPAYPRGYKALGLDHQENWEKREVDASDPVPWAERIEQRRRAHAAHLGSEGRR